MHNPNLVTVECPRCHENFSAVPNAGALCPRPDCRLSWSPANLMNVDEAKAWIAVQDEKLRDLEARVARLAPLHLVPVVLAVLRALVEMVCQPQGAHFAVLRKIKLYEAVLRLLSERGIS